ncbi:hypothetical protein C7H19_00135 [Aphanothece hegewaldii CCALA 016]|uniref:Prepilin-type cleavage/methylation domain-containing protein n=1 Tax=Aphanothece hegewaldii CCALA 016 TaxID=2107694 RepID=A0A2T1M331_9CHRO|nr:type II secretion system protein [Aphanothece hegewaldii]PSF39235.1 hypothetical protein C7H19_00135 [Aphanothece hegewaldii CCALA 016]
MKKYQRSRHFDKGFTLVELLVTVMIMGILAVVAMPNWFKYINEQRLNEATDATETLLRNAQNRAKQEAQNFRVDFRVSNNIPQASMYRTDSSASSCWTYLDSLGNKKSPRDDCLNLSEANQITLSLIQGNSITFSNDGSIAPNSPLQPNENVTLTIPNLSNTPYRCVRIKTILGSMDKGKDSTECQQS